MLLRCSCFSLCEIAGWASRAGLLLLLGLRDYNVHLPLFCIQLTAAYEQINQSPP